MGCGSSSGPGATTQQVTQTTSPPPQVLAAYQNLLNRGTAAANAPLQQWQGPTIAGFNPTQQSAFSEIAGAQGAALPYINTAAQYAAQGTTPVINGVQQFNPQTLSQYQNPYTQQVTQATQNLFNEQNAEQFNQANSAAASAGAFGGDRESVLEGQMAQQQQLAEAPTLANIQQQGFTGAENELNTQQNLQLQAGSATDWLNQNAAGLMGGLGTSAQSSLLSGAQGQLSAGDMMQQLQQQEMNVPIAQFEQQQAYPFQTTNFLAGLTEGIAPGEGATATTTEPGPNALSQGIGLGALGLGAAGSLGFQPFAPASTPAQTTGNAMGGRIGSYRRGGRTVYGYDLGGMVGTNTSLGPMTVRRARPGLVPYMYSRASGGLVPRFASGGQSPTTDSNVFQLLPGTSIPDMGVSYIPGSGSAGTGAGGVTVGGTGSKLSFAPQAASQQSPVQAGMQALSALKNLKGAGGNKDPLVSDGQGGTEPLSEAQDDPNSPFFQAGIPTTPDVFTAPEAPADVVGGDMSEFNVPAGAPDLLGGGDGGLLGASGDLGSGAGDLLGGGAGDLVGSGGDELASLAPDLLSLANRGGRMPARRGGGLVPRFANGGDTTILDIIPGFDPSSATLGNSPDQHNRDVSYIGQGIGMGVGAYFGGPEGAAAGSAIGSKVGGGFGNMIAGRDFYNGSTGNFWDNFNPLSANGAASLGQSLNMGMLPQTMMGSMTGGGLPGLPGMGGGGLPGLRKGGLVPHYDDGGGVTPPVAQGANPLVQQQYQRYAQLPLEQLQELAVRMPPNSVQGQMVQRAMQLKRMAPASTAAYPSAQPGTPQQQPAQPGYRRGGLVPRLAAGGTGGDPVSFSSISSPSGISVPQIRYAAPQNLSEVGPAWSPGQPFSGSPAGSPPTPTAATGPVLTTPLSPALTGATPSPASLLGPSSLNIGGIEIPLTGALKRGGRTINLRRGSGGLVPHYAGDDGETQAVLSDDALDPQRPGFASAPPDVTSGVVADDQNAPDSLSGFFPHRGAAPAQAPGKVDPYMALMIAGAGMMSSRSPTLLGGLGEGAMAGLQNVGQQKQQIAQQQYRDQQLALGQRRADAAETRANAPHVGSSAPRIDDGGGTLRVIYSNGSAFDTGLANPATTALPDGVDSQASNASDLAADPWASVGQISAPQGAVGNAIDADRGRMDGQLAQGRTPADGATVRRSYQPVAYGVRQAGDDNEIALPDRLQNALDEVRSRIAKLGNPDWSERFARWQIIPDEKFGQGLTGPTDYPAQATKFFTWETETPSLTDDELRFAVAHEFAHLLPDNNALIKSQTVGQQFAAGPHPAEVQADAIARRILGMTRNPGIFARRPVD
jgi:hypothetical protein